MKSRILSVLLATVLLPIIATGCIMDTMPDVQGIPSSVKFVEACGQPATLFTVNRNPRIATRVFALVPQVDFTSRDRIAIYDEGDGILNIVINGQDKKLQAKLYRLGIASYGVAIGWDWPRNLAELERQLGCSE